VSAAYTELDGTVPAARLAGQLHALQLRACVGGFHMKNSSICLSVQHSQQLQHCAMRPRPTHESSGGKGQGRATWHRHQEGT
jgi:hypothetical protein